VSVRTVDVPDWPRPRGYANGMIATGRVLHVAGLVEPRAKVEIQAVAYLEG
jgi:hypothetical protein